MADQITQPDLSRRIALLPLRSAVLFPGVVVPFDVGRTKTLALAESLAAAIARKEEVYVVAFTQKRSEDDDPGVEDLHPVGTLARILGAVRQPDGNYAVVAQGVARVRLDAIVASPPYHLARVERAP